MPGKGQEQEGQDDGNNHANDGTNCTHRHSSWWGQWGSFDGQEELGLFIGVGGNVSFIITLLSHTLENLSSVLDIGYILDSLMMRPTSRRYFPWAIFIDHTESVFKLFRVEINNFCVKFPNNIRLRKTKISFATKFHVFSFKNFCFLTILVTSDNFHGNCGWFEEFNLKTLCGIIKVSICQDSLNSTVPGSLIINAGIYTNLPLDTAYMVTILKLHCSFIICIFAPTFSITFLNPRLCYLTSFSSTKRTPPQTTC